MDIAEHLIENSFYSFVEADILHKDLATHFKENKLIDEQAKICNVDKEIVFMMTMWIIYTLLDHEWYENIKQEYKLNHPYLIKHSERCTCDKLGVGDMFIFNSSVYTKTEKGFINLNTGLSCKLDNNFTVTKINKDIRLEKLLWLTE